MLVIKLINDGTGDNLVGNYRYTVEMKPPYGGSKVIARGTIKGHTRAWGWKALVYNLLSREK